MMEKFDRNFEEYMEEEQPQQPVVENDELYNDEDDDQTNLMNLLAYLEDELTNARVVPMTGKRMLDAEMCLDIINDIRANLPHAVQYARQILNDRERISRSAEQTAANRVNSAKAHADAILDDANERANRVLADANKHAEDIIKDAEIRVRAMIDQSNIMKQAQLEADEIIREVREEAQERRNQAANYCDSLLHDAEETLQAAFDDIRRNRQALAQSRIDARQ